MSGLKDSDLQYIIDMRISTLLKFPNEEVRRSFLEPPSPQLCILT